MSTFHTTTPRTDAALAQVAKARETESDYKCHNPLILSHVSLEMDYNGLRSEVERLREALAGCVKQCADYENMTDDCAAAFRKARAALKGAA